MDSGAVRDVLEVTLGLAVGIGLLMLATRERPDPGLLLGLGLVPLFVLALSAAAGPLEEQTAWIGAVVVLGLCLGAVFWLWLP